MGRRRRKRGGEEGTSVEKSLVEEVGAGARSRWVGGQRARGRRGQGGAGAGRSLLESGAEGQHVLTHPPAFNFPCFLGILILFSGKLPVP